MKRQITNLISKNLTDSDLESVTKIKLDQPKNLHTFTRPNFWFIQPKNLFYITKDGILDTICLNQTNISVDSTKF